jgi:hypothetical protein
MTTILVVHRTEAPAVLGLIALCDEHTAIVKRATWCGVDEVIGFSSIMACEACALLVGGAHTGEPTGPRPDPRFRPVWPLAEARAIPSIAAGS